MSIWKNLTQAVSQLTGSNDQESQEPALPDPTVDTEDADGNILTNEYKIIEMLMDVVDGKSEILLTFGSKVLAYKTHMLPDQESGLSSGSEPSSEYLRDKAYILIGDTDPPEGAIKLLNGHPATLSFAYGGRFNEFATELQVPTGEIAVGKGGVTALAGKYPIPPQRPGLAKRAGAPSAATPGTPPGVGAAPASAQQEAAGGMAVPAGPFKVVFPDTIFRKKRQRSTVRVQYLEEARVVLHVRREAGSKFPCTIMDVGTGGLCFAFPRDEAAIAEGSEVESTFLWEEGSREVTVRGTLLKMGTRKGKTTGQIVFVSESYEVIRALGEVVSHIERVRLQFKAKKF